jgi:hypothetical protein
VATKMLFDPTGNFRNTRRHIDNQDVDDHRFAAYDYLPNL